MAGVAFFYIDPGAFGGGVQANDVGFTWNMVAVYRDTVTNRKDVVTGIQAQTLDGDTLVQVRDKLAAAIKSDGATRGFSISTVVFYPLNTLAV